MEQIGLVLLLLLLPALFFPMFSSIGTMRPVRTARWSASESPSHGRSRS